MDQALASSAATAPAFAAARNICRHQAKEFFLATAFLPVAKRNAVCAVFAFARMLREAIRPAQAAEEGVPVPSSVGVACCSTNSIDQTLALLRQRLDEIYERRLELPRPEFRDESQHALEAFSRTVHRYQIAKQYFLDLAEGFRMDLTISRYATWGSLEKFCRATGGVGGLILSCILGLTHSDASRRAVQLGNAMRLTNILRDLPADLARGRIYLPLEDLARFKLSQADLLAMPLQVGGCPSAAGPKVGVAAVSAPFQDLMRFQIARARDLYRQGAEGICWLEGDGSRLTASMLAVLHSGLLAAIERRGYDVFSRRPRLSAAARLRRMPQAWRLAWRAADRPVPEVFG
jgi:phytoene synthase